MHSINLTILLLAAAAITALTINFLGPQAYRWLQIRRWRRRSNLIALTYDDGPDAVTSGELLEVLEEAGVKATFYLVGFRAERDPDVVRRIADAGHEIGTHSYSHKHAWKVMPWTDLADVMHGYSVLTPFAGDHAPFRPPFGKVSFPTFLYLIFSGRRVDWWTSPTNDTDDTFEDVDQVASRLVDGSNPVVLMHSHHDEPHRREFMLATTKAVIAQARAKGLHLATMRELNRATRSGSSSARKRRRAYSDAE